MIAERYDGSHIASTRNKTYDFRGSPDESGDARSMQILLDHMELLCTDSFLVSYA